MAFPVSFDRLLLEPEIGILSFQENPSAFAKELFRELPRIDPRVLRILLYQLAERLLDLRKLWDLRDEEFLPEWYFHFQGSENFLIALKYNLPVDLGGNLPFWWQIQQKLSHELLDAFVLKGIDLNQINAAEGYTLLEKAIEIENEENVHLLLSHQVNPDERAMKLALLQAEEIASGASLRILRDLRVYGGQTRPYPPDSDIGRYLQAATQMRPEYCPLEDKTFLDRNKDLSLWLSLYPHLVDQMKTKGLRKSIDRVRNQVTLTQTGQVLSWPFYQASFEVEKPDFCLQVPQRVRVAQLPEAGEIYENALLGLKDKSRTISYTDKLPRGLKLPPTPFMTGRKTFPLP